MSYRILSALKNLIIYATNMLQYAVKKKITLKAGIDTPN